jgi:hypothetical protein
MQQFRDQVDRDVVVFIHRIGKDPDTPLSLHSHTVSGDALDLGDIAYAKDAGLNTMKQCLPETRTDILSKITDWINGSGGAAERVLWLFGPAGTGKSAIAHTIAKWFSDMGMLGSCFCFDKIEKRHEKVFSTIARDLAGHDPEMRRALADAVRDSPSLKNTKDILQQWEKLLVEPLKKSSRSSVGPVLIVIEALDESGGAKTREDLLRILAGKHQNKGLPKITELPSNFRILVTSRPLRDIENTFHGTEHIRPLTMEEIPPAVAKRDICTFVSAKLDGLSGFGDEEFGNLATKAEGLFEWARLACEYIKEDLPGVDPRSRFGTVLNRDPGTWKDKLYDMYRLLLADIWPRDRYSDVEYQKALAGFRSVMGQILSTAEPLPFDSLNVMRDRFPNYNKHHNVNIIQHMGSLLSGTTNTHIPVKPLHASFQEFLTDKSSSGDFFVEVTKAQHHDLALASLGVMEHDLRFNMCNLKSSYLPNREDTELPERVKTSISPHLSYSCRFWATHVQTTDFDDELAKAIRSFFDDERLLFWIEALGLLNGISGAAAVLPLVAKWLKVSTCLRGSVGCSTHK